jgi:actin-related protein 9
LLPDISVADIRLVGDAPAAAASHKKKSTAAAAATAAANKAAADAVAAAAADVITINIPSLPEKEITVGQVRHRLCEPLLRGKNGGDTVWEGMGRAISNATMSPAEKMAVWEGVVVVGETARIKCEFIHVD